MIRPGPKERTSWVLQVFLQPGCLYKGTQRIFRYNIHRLFVVTHTNIKLSKKEIVSQKGIVYLYDLYKFIH